MAETLNYHDQDYYRLRQLHNRSNLFSDSTFPPDQSSIGGSFTPCVWRRPGQICHNPQFTVQGISRFDLHQGEIGNCWFIAAVQALVQDQELFNLVVPPDQGFGPGYSGVFHFRFWRKNRWVEVVIDDYLPTTKDGQLLYCHNRVQPNEFWAPLLEKAYAKLYGSYNELDGGVTENALVELTAGEAKSYQVRKQSPQAFWQKMFDAHLRRALMTCSIFGSRFRKAGHSIEEKLPNGLLTDHAYTVTKVTYIPEMDHLQLIRLRNPWGNEVEWNGDWSDQSPRWARIPPHIRNQLGLVKAADGEFWMSYEDFIENFDYLTICYIPENKPYPAGINSMYSDNSYGYGYPSYDSSYDNSWNSYDTNGYNNDNNYYYDNSYYGYKKSGGILSTLKKLFFGSDDSNYPPPPPPYYGGGGGGGGFPPLFPFHRGNINNLFGLFNAFRLFPPVRQLPYGMHRPYGANMPMY